MPSNIFREMSNGFRRLDKIFLNFKPRHGADYTKRQISMAAAYTVFCHAEIEIFLETWARTIVDFAEASWRSKRATRPLVHLCTFHEGRGALTSVPQKDIWNEVVYSSIAKHKGVISGNNGIKDSNICALLSPLGFDTTQIDTILMGDISAFGVLRGHHAHNSHRVQIGSMFDPFDRRTKVGNLEVLLKVLDAQLVAYLKSA